MSAAHRRANDGEAGYAGDDRAVASDLGLPRGRVRQEAGEVARRLVPMASPELAGAGRNGDEE